MKPSSILVVAAFLSLAGLCPARGEFPASLQAVVATLPPREVAILLDVGEEYDLEGEALKLLLVIRKIENGGPGLEMGVGSMTPGHRARRYAGSPDASLRIQARWAAGTIRKHYAGDLDVFARRYCPPQWRHWAYMARSWMDKS